MPAMNGVLPPVQHRHCPAPTDPDKVGALMRAIDGMEGRPVVVAAVRLAPRLFVRPGELRRMEWAEVDLAARRWVIPAGKMKMREELIVPLARQCVEILQGLYPVCGHSRYVFPSVRCNTRPISDMTVNAALRRLGFGSDEVTGHGFRAMARTLLDEVGIDT